MRAGKTTLAQLEQTITDQLFGRKDVDEECRAAGQCRGCGKKFTPEQAEMCGYTWFKCDCGTDNHPRAAIARYQKHLQEQIEQLTRDHDVAMDMRENAEEEVDRLQRKDQKWTEWQARLIRALDVPSGAHVVTHAKEIKAKADKSTTPHHHPADQQKIDRLAEQVEMLEGERKNQLTTIKELAEKNAEFKTGEKSAAWLREQWEKRKRQLIEENEKLTDKLDAAKKDYKEAQDRADSLGMRLVHSERANGDQRVLLREARAECPAVA